MIPAMDLLHYTSQSSTFRFFCPHYPSSAPLTRRFFSVRSSLPFPNHKAKYHKELKAAVDVVERACRLCIDVKRSLFSGSGRILEKNDQTPVTVADFGVQALVSLELNKLFPSIPLVAEEDSAFIRSNNLVDSVISAVADKASFGDEPLTESDLLDAIDRGGKNAVAFGTKPATYWVLDPIDGTKGFLKGSEALYVVGLALVVDGEIVLGVMGCPNWKENLPCKSTAEVEENETYWLDQGLSWLLMLAVEHGQRGCRVCWISQPKHLIVGPDALLIAAAQYMKHTFVFQRVKHGIHCHYQHYLMQQLMLIVLEIMKLFFCPDVVEGKASVFILRQRAQTIIKAWDHAVGVICVHEAGGKVSDWKGIQLDFAADLAERRIIFPSVGILVSNGNVHSQILGMISSTSSVV